MRGRQSNFKILCVGTMNYPDDMFEEASRREASLKAVEKLYEENGDALKQLAEIETEERMMSRKNRVQQVMNEYYSKLGPGPYYYDNSAVAAALREAVEGLNIEPDPDRELSIEKHHFIRGQNWVKDAILNLAVELDVEEL
jgi:hypothetical protein